MRKGEGWRACASHGMGWTGDFNTSGHALDLSWCHLVVGPIEPDDGVVDGHGHRRELGTSSGPSLVNARWNEVLAHPFEGHDPFLEPAGPIPVSDVTWHVTAQTPVCFAP